MSSKVLISASSLSKTYAVYHRPEDRLKQMLCSFIRPGWKKFYDEFWALKDASLEIRRGESVGIIGRNGSGKSTLLQIIAGTLAQTTGDLSVNGRIGALLELGAGFNPEFTGRENVYLSASILGLSQDEIEKRFDSIAAFAGIGDFLDQPVKTYSSGMFARLAFAVVAHIDADILIVDEILSVGDITFTQRCSRFLEKFRANGTLLLVSHDTHAITKLCDKVIWMDRGRVRMVGPAKEICFQYMASTNSELDESSSFHIGGERKSAVLSKTDNNKNDTPSYSSSVASQNNPIEAFEFDQNAPWFGQNGAKITEVKLTDENTEPLKVFSGGENVSLIVTARTSIILDRPIIGFFLVNRLGQNLFGDNTYITTKESRQPVPENGLLTARFDFQLPFLPAGDYSFTVAVANGNQNDAVIHQWIEDALHIKVHSSLVAQGLIGIPMSRISLEVQS